MWVEISPIGALLWCLLTPLVFIGSIYIYKPKEAERDEPREIKRRFLVIGLTTIIWPFLFFFTFSDHEKSSEGPNFLVWLGLFPNLNGYLAILISLSLTFCLYLGPLFQLLFDEGDEFTFDLKAVRALIAAPVYEETIFRACLILPLISAGFGLYTSMLISSLTFGLSHLYHLVEIFSQTVIKKDIRDKRIKANLMQVFYTTIFGLYVGYLYIGTGTLYAPIIAHSFCNHMGLPDLSFLDENSPIYKYKSYLLVFYTVGLLAFLILLPLIAHPSLLKGWPYTLSLKVN